MKKYWVGSLGLRFFLLTILNTFFCSLLFAQSGSKRNCKVSGNKYSFYLYEAVEPVDTSQENYGQRLKMYFDSTSIRFEKKYFQVSSNNRKVTGKYKIKFNNDSCLVYLIVKPMVKHMFEGIDEEKMRMSLILTVICRNAIYFEKDLLVATHSHYENNPATNSKTKFSHKFLFKR